MSLFENVWAKAKEAITKYNIEKKLKANYKKMVCAKEELIAEKESEISKLLTEEHTSFAHIYELFLDIKEKKEEIEILKEAYEYVFNKEDKKEEK